VSYLLHVPAGPPPVPGGFPLLIVVHDTTRNAVGCRDAFARFADEYRAAVLAPLFTAEATEPADAHNYKLLAPGPLRPDLALLHMVDEVAAGGRVAAGRFLLHGFSGGAQFAHRFLYLHPDRLAGVSVAAPGRVTPLNESLRWWGGVADAQERFGRLVKIDSVRRVPVQVLAGGADRGPVEPGNPGGEIAATGADRVARGRFLHDSLVQQGVPSQFELVPDAGHEPGPLLPAARRFLAASWPILAGRRQTGQLAKGDAVPAHLALPLERTALTSPAPEPSAPRCRTEGTMCGPQPTATDRSDATCCLLAADLGCWSRVTCWGYRRVAFEQACFQEEGLWRGVVTGHPRD
jgi:dienelactone hydrolase